MFRQRARTLSSFARRRLNSASAISYRPSRHDPEAVINLRPDLVSEALTNDYKRYQLTTSEARFRVNTFLNSVFANDITRATTQLTTLRAKCLNGTAFIKNREVYTACFIALLYQVLQTETYDIRMVELKQILAAVREIPNQVRQLAPEKTKKIQSLTILVILRVLSGLKNKHGMQGMDLITYAREAKRIYDIDADDVLELVVSEAPNLIGEFNQVFCTNACLPHDDDRTNLSIERYRTSKGSLTYGRLCDFISDNPFNYAEFHTPSHRDLKMWQVYDNISSKDKGEFMAKYVAYNRKKQIIVEQNSSNLHVDLNPGFMADDFTVLHRNWIRQWSRAVKSRLDEMASQDGYKYGFFHSAVTSDELTSLVFAHLMKGTVIDNHIMVLKLVSSLRSALYQSLRSKKVLAPIHGQLRHFLNEEDSADFLCGVVKVFVDVCKLDYVVGDNGLQHNDGSSNLFEFGYSSEDLMGPSFKRAGVIKMHPYVAEKFKVYREVLQTGSYKLPMLCPPKSWTSPVEGGYLTDLEPLVKAQDQQFSLHYMTKAHKTGQLRSVYQGLNALGQTAWTVNNRVFNVFRSAMTTREGFGSIPAPLGAVEPPRQTSPPKMEEFQNENEFKKAWGRWKVKSAEDLKQYRLDQSVRAFYECVFEFGRSLDANGDIFYLPHNVDFRGRVYPMVSFFSHHNEDLIRGMMMFWEAKPLGEEGYGWLCYQLANLHSAKKIDMRDLIDYVHQNRERISACSQNPALYEDWWQQSDLPWQCLALCFELNDIWEWETTNPIGEYRSRIPVHQDGTCNGLQHYAALGGDVEAARTVNILPSGKKQDIYAHVAELVQHRLQNDMRSKSESIRFIAERALSLLSRKVVKQTVMTTVYGLTRYGARRQIGEKVRAALAHRPQEDLSETHKMEIVNLITDHVFDTISSLFAGARKIQSWLSTNCTRSIQAMPEGVDPPKRFKFLSSKSYMPMMWTSLSGFPVIQHYRKLDLREIKTPLQTLSYRNFTEFAPVDSIKQVNGIAPNFIHSLDAIHLLMTCLVAREEDFLFAGVHDSFWTHACDVPKLSKAIREEFVRLHQSGIIENLQMDLQHVVKDRLQLVWVSNEDNADLVAELSELRRDYDYGKERTHAETDRLNFYLSTELKNNSAVKTLVESYRPTLLFATGDSFVEYDSSRNIKKVHRKFSRKLFTPLLVPVRLVEYPSVGNLDITQVLQSKYFFS